MLERDATMQPYNSNKHINCTEWQPAKPAMPANAGMKASGASGSQERRAAAHHCSVDANLVFVYERNLVFVFAPSPILESI
jgi:hypothetical protein